MKAKFLGVTWIAALGCLAGCSSSNGASTNDADTDAARTDAGLSDGSSKNDSETREAEVDSETEDAGAAAPIYTGAPCTSENLVGSWQVLLTSGALTFTFHSDGTFAENLYDAEDAGCSDDEEITGTYTVSKGMLTLTVMEATCPSVDIFLFGPNSACVFPDANAYVTSSSGGGTLVLMPLTSPLDAGTIVLGCGSPFVQYPLMPINRNNQ